MRSLILLSLFLIGLNARAGEARSQSAEDCVSARFPFSRTQSKEDLHRLFESTDRKALVAYFFHEISQPQSQSVAKALSVYLIQTELDKDRRSFFKLLSYSAELYEHPKKPKKLDLNELCSIYGRT